MTPRRPEFCYSCESDRLARVASFSSPPPGETLFSFSRHERYLREIWRCGACGHFMNAHSFDLRGFYAGDYVSSTYGENGLDEAFDRILRLDPGRSDNVSRVRTIMAYARRRRWNGQRPPRVLDVGSGLCVFLHRMKQEGWDCTALDPDDRAADHAERRVGVRAVRADFLLASELGRYHLVTFNKVLEHVPEPVPFLRKAVSILLPDGGIYVEVPDGEAAVEEGFHREEFFIDHFHIFSEHSFLGLVRKVGLKADRWERTREPSGKFTLRGFLMSAGQGTETVAHA